jgi:hypothetical protein
MTGLWTEPMTSCQTLVCVYNQLQMLEPQDYFMGCVLLLYVVGLVVALIVAVKG